MPQFPHSKYSASPSAGVFIRGQGSHSPMVEADISEFVASPPEYVHPFKVTNLGIETGNEGTAFTFKVYEGRVFGLTDTEARIEWSVSEEITYVEIGASITENPPGIFKPGILLNENNTTVFSGTLSSTETNMIYVKIAPGVEVSNVWTASLELKTLADALEEKNLGTIKTEMLTELPDGDISDVPFDVVLPPINDFDTIILQIIERQVGKRFFNFRWTGTFQIPVASVTLVGDKWVVRQILRSDIFFPHGSDYLIWGKNEQIQEFTGSTGCFPQ